MSFTIQAAHVTNLKAIREADLSDMDSLVLIGGKNGAGKTGLLRVLAGAVGFPWPDDLLRDGQAKGEATVELVDGDETFNVKVVAHRAKNRAGQFTGKVTTKLTITQGTGKDVREIKNPRDWLKSRLSGKHFDVLAAIDDFATPAGERRVLERMRDAAGIDFTDLDAEKAGLREVRQFDKRTLAAAEARRDAIPDHPDCPAPVVVADLVAERDAIKAKNDEIDKRQHNAERVVEEQEQYAIRLKEEIALLQGRLGNCQAIIEEYGKVAAEAAKAARDDLGNLPGRIANAESNNFLARQQELRKEHVAEAAKVAGQVAEADARLAAIAEKKRSVLATADFGVDGLTLSDDLTTILWEGEPLRRVSDGNKIAIFAMLHAAQNPEIGVMFSTRASLLDDEHLAFCDEVAKSMGMQFILEVVGSREGAIVIEATEDGSIAKQEAKSDA